MLAAACTARRARPRLHDDRVARGVEDACGSRNALGFLERDHIGVEAADYAAHRGIISIIARVAAGAVSLGEEFQVPARDL